VCANLVNRKCDQDCIAGCCRPAASVSSQAAFGETADSPLVRVDAEHLADEKAWLALMHYRRTWVGRDWISEADAPAFFLAPDGKHDPACRTGRRCSRTAARFGEWSVDSLPFPGALPVASKRLSVRSTVPFRPTVRHAGLAHDATRRSLSIDFAASYLENPSSMSANILAIPQ